MYPILAAAKRSDKYDKAYLNGDILRINGIDYSVDNFDNLPKDLHPNNFAIKENEHWLVFGGIHSNDNDNDNDNEYDLLNINFIQ